jgi:hypothetical protein
MNKFVDAAKKGSGKVSSALDVIDKAADAVDRADNVSNSSRGVSNTVGGLLSDAAGVIDDLPKNSKSGTRVTGRKSSTVSENSIRTLTKPNSFELYGTVNRKTEPSAPKLPKTPDSRSIDSRSETNPKQGIATGNARAARLDDYMNGRLAYKDFAEGNGRPAPVYGQQIQTKPFARPAWANNNDNINYGNYPQAASEIERQLLNAAQPLHSLSTRETISAGGFSGLYLNRHEANEWRGPVPVDEYPINQDPNPEVIRKHIEKVHYEQVCATRWLNPGPAPRSGINIKIFIFK